MIAGQSLEPAGLKKFAVAVVVRRSSTVLLRCWADLAVASSIAVQPVVGSAECRAAAAVER